MQVRPFPSSAVVQTTAKQILRTRRVKCDESKPICQRCARADRACEYASKQAVSTICAPSSPSPPSSNPALSCSLGLGPTYDDLPLYDISLSPTYALSDAIWQSPEESRLATLGCWVLSNDPMIEKVAVPNSSVWMQLLPQLVHSSRTAYASAAAFGAAYESCLISKDRRASENIAPKLYSKALSAMQEDLPDLSSGTAPVLLSCVLLACVEVLQRRRGNALRHLEGAFKVLELSDDAGLCLTPPATIVTPPTESSPSPETTPAPVIPKRDDLFLLLKSLDLLTSTYVLSRTPSLPARIPSFPAFPNDHIEYEFLSVRGADLRLIIILHNLHHFTSFASKMKYLPPACIPRASSIEQGRHIAQLALWLKCLDANVLHGNHNLSPQAHRHALMLRAQCLVAQVYASTILCPYETEYDRHASSFQQITEIAEVVVAAKMESTIKFRPGLGIIQPLLFTSLKYRHSAWRRRAIALLMRADIEGPWQGKIEGAVAQRVVEIEEESFDEPGEELTPDMIPERKRVCGQKLLHDNCVDSPMNSLRISLSRCVDVEYMISGKESFESCKHWNVWEEDVPVF